MASSVQPLIQKALNTCQEHTDEELDMYCKTCKKAVCSECVKSKHLQHDWVPMSKYTRELRGRAQTRALEVNSIAESMYKARKEMADYWNDTHDKECSKRLSELESTRSRLHDLIDGIIDDRKKEVKTFHDEKKEKLSSKALEKEWGRLKKMTLQLREEGGTLSNSDIIELYDDIAKSLSAITSMSECSVDCFEHVIYEKGEVEEEKLEKMVGNTRREPAKILDSSLSLLKEMNFQGDKQDDSGSKETEKRGKKEEDYSIYCIRPVSDSSAWISCGGKCSNVDIETSTDDTLKGYTFKLFDLSVNTGTFYFFNVKNQCILTITKAGERKDIFKTTPLIPNYLTITHSGDLLISLVDEGIFTRGRTSRRLLRKTTQTGLTLKEYEYDNDGKSPLFTMPNKAVEHYHGQICVINLFNDESGNVIGVVYGLDPAGRVQYKYNNNNDGFQPLDICSDMMGNTLILDDSDDSLHCVSSQGCLLKYLELRKWLDFAPYTIGLYKNKLWVGSYETGQVNVYEYKY